jgi:hypothetical protein
VLFRSCLADGTGYGACDCGAAGDAGATDAATVEAGQGDASAGDTADAALQDDAAAQTDAPEYVCFADGGCLKACSQNEDCWPGQLCFVAKGACYTPGRCEPALDMCLGAPTFSCRGSLCPCVPGANPNCRNGEYCCFGLCHLDVSDAGHPC